MEHLRNKYINLNTKINFIENNNYIRVSTYQDLKLLRATVKNNLNLNRGIIVNNATGICARITKETVNKIIFPKSKFNLFNACSIAPIPLNKVPNRIILKLQSL